MDNQRKKIYGQTRDDERALYALRDADVESCVFSGPADGESALKECKNITVTACEFRLRYPLWHAENYTVKDTHMDVNARAAVWYGKSGVFDNCRLEGIKVFRECDNTIIRNCTISSFEAGWSCRGIELYNCKVLSEYLLLGSKKIIIENCELDGKYPLQYAEDVVLKNCTITSKDCLWHAKNVTCERCIFRGEYLGWYSENLTLKDCHIEGTQPLCYCKKLRLDNCTTENCDFSFELSEIDADIRGRVLSIRSPLSGVIVCDGLGALVEDVKGYDCRAKIIVRDKS